MENLYSIYKHVNQVQCLSIYQKILKYMLYQLQILLNLHGELIAHLMMSYKENILVLV